MHCTTTGPTARPAVAASRRVDAPPGGRGLAPLGGQGSTPPSGRDWYLLVAAEGRRVEVQDNNKRRCGRVQVKNVGERRPEGTRQDN
jgi:hypothetical protein